MRKSALFKQNVNSELCYELFVLFLWSQSILVSYARAIWMMLPEIWNLADMVIGLAYWTLFVFSLTAFVRRLWTRDLLFFVTVLLIYVAYYWLFPDNQYYYALYSETFAEKALPMFLVGASIIPNKSQRLYQGMYWLSIVTILAFTAYKLVLHPLEGGTQSAGDMYAAYLFLPHLCVVTGHAMKKTNPINLSVSVLGGFVLVSLGTRGTVVCFLVFILLMLLLFQKRKRPVLYISAFILVAIALVFSGLLEWLYDFAENFGLSLRVLDKLQSGSFGESSGRVLIAGRVWEYILLNPLTGMGIYSDRRVAGGQYAHNILLELVIDFGVIVGLMLFVLLIVLILKAVLCVRRYEGNGEAGILLLTYICSGFVKLFLSGSYLNETTLFFLIGYCFIILREDKLNGLKSPGIRTSESEARP